MGIYLNPNAFNIPWHTTCLVWRSIRILELCAKHDVAIKREAGRIMLSAMKINTIEVVVDETLEAAVLDETLAAAAATEMFDVAAMMYQQTMATVPPPPVAQYRACHPLILRSVPRAQVHTANIKLVARSKMIMATLYTTVYVLSCGVQVHLTTSPLADVRLKARRQLHSHSGRGSPTLADQQEDFKRDCAFKNSKDRNRYKGEHEPVPALRLGSR